MPLTGTLPMTDPWFDPQLFIFTLLTVGGIFIGSLGLIATSWPRYHHPVGWVLVASLFLLVSFSGMAFAFHQPRELCFSPLVLGVFASLFWMLPSPTFYWPFLLISKQFQLRAMRFSLWCSFLVCMPALAVLWGLGAEAEAEEGLPEAVSLENLASPRPGLEEVQPSPVSTDRKRLVKVMRPLAMPPAPDPDFLRRQTKMLTEFGLLQHAIRMSNGWHPCNCHGWVFTGGAFWLTSDQVSTILEDNRYEPTFAPKSGDLAVYRDSEGDVVHTGIVRYVARDGLTLVESKWGRLGRFIHPADVHCYEGTVLTIYRSPRRGHLLLGLPRDSFSGPDPELLGDPPSIR